MSERQRSLTSGEAKFIVVLFHVWCVAALLFHLAASQTSGPAPVSTQGTTTSTSGQSLGSSSTGFVSTSSAAATSPPSTLTLPDRTTCVCDLSVGLCNLRCCCDPDCSSSDRSVFSSCADIATTPVTQSCVSSRLIVDSNNAYQTVTDESTNLFCVSVDNNPARLSYVVPDVVSDAVTFRQLVSRFGDPTLTLPSPSPLTWQRSYYRSGEAILTLSPPNVQGWLAAPTSLGASKLCTDYNPVPFPNRHVHDLSATYCQLAGIVHKWITLIC